LTRNDNTSGEIAVVAYLAFYHIGHSFGWGKAWWAFTCAMVFGWVVNLFNGWADRRLLR
jgi:hypothetical protein